MEQVVLVDEQDQEIGLQEKLEAHKKGQLHRAFSLFVVNSKGEMLIHQRANEKYHCPGLWTNAVCSHPRHQEKLEEAVKRRAQEEMGLQIAELKKLFHFVYKAEFDNGLTEHEFDHVFISQCDALPQLNPAEVQDFKYLSFDELDKAVNNNPEQFTVWFREAYPKVKALWKKN